MATPHVSATAALVVASRILGPNPTPAQIVARLKGTARDLGAPGVDEHSGWGLVDAGAATTQPFEMPGPPREALARTSVASTGKQDPIVRVHAPVALRARPRGAVLVNVPTRTVFGSAQTLSVVATAGRWLQVTSERLPTGRTGWIDRRSAGVSVARTPLSIRVSLHARTLELRAGIKGLQRVRSSGPPSRSGRLSRSAR
jgi:hypothetical protein